MLRFQVVEPNSEFVAMARELLVEYASEIDRDFCLPDYDNELKNLPGIYIAPRGMFLLLMFRDQPAACGAFRESNDGYCELKRVFVRPDYRGAGFGRMISEELLKRALGAGYRKMRLDTLTTMHAAHAMYRMLGFAETHRESSDRGPGLVFMERML